MSALLIDLNTIPPEPSEAVRQIQHRRWLRQEIAAISSRARDPEDDLTHERAAFLIDALPEEAR